MALKVWLPLNGSLENKGINGINLTSTAFTVDNNGKIGKCIKTTSSASIDLGYDGNQINTGDLSFGGWFKISEAEVSPILNSGNYTSTYKAATSNLLGNDSYGGIGLIWVTNNIYNSTFSSMNVFATIRTSSVNQTTSSTSIEFDKWIHLFLTFEKSTGILSFYKNGVLINSKTFSNFSDAISRNLMLNYKAVYGGNAITFNLPYYVNDVRIYDHCLSPLEVKEISQGLILHYKLDGFGGGVGENLLSKYVSPGQQNPGVTTTAGRTNYYGDYGIIIPATENADTYFRLFTNTQLEQNTQYTISCEVSGLLPGSYYRFPLYAQGNTSMGVLNLDHNGICSLTFIMTYATQTAITVDGRTVYLCFMDDSARAIVSGQGAITVKNFKIEKGPIATSFILEMSELGIDTTKIIDSSGYENDGCLVNGTNETVGINNGRYQVCTSLLGTTVDSTSNTITGAQYLYVPLKMPAWTAITVAWWGNNIAYGRGGIFETTGTTGNIWEGSDYNTTAIANWDSTFGIFNGSTRVNIFNNFIKDSTWHHHAITFDGTNVRYYCDSILKQTSALTGTLPAITGFKMGLGKAGGVYRQIKQKLNDLRIYATALSAEDIATLYHTPAQIDNLNNIYSFEFIENDDNYNAITKNGAWNTVAIKERILPEEYTELEYIESSGTQYIDTQIQPCMDTIRCVCDMMPLNNNDTAFFGARGTYYLFYNLANNYFWPTSRCEFSQGILSIGNKYHVDWNKGILTVTFNGNTMQKGLRTNATQDTRNMYIFNFNPIDSRSTTARLYYFKIYVNDILQRDFIPCYRNADQTIGLYDLISNTFFENAGSGVFIPGQKVKENTKYAKILKETKENEAFSFIEK